MRRCLHRFLTYSVCLLAFEILTFEDSTCQLSGTLFRRVSRLSNSEFAIYNNGMLLGDWSHETRSGWLFGQPTGYWPRGTFHMLPLAPGQGFVFLAQKNGRLHASEAAFIRPAKSSHGAFDQMVPGRIGDTRAGFDTVFNGPGWCYIDDPDYIVFSSLDYDATGVDTSGANYNDWPIRLIHGQQEYVGDVAHAHFTRPFISRMKICFASLRTQIRELINSTQERMVRVYPSA